MRIAKFANYEDRLVHRKPGGRAGTRIGTKWESPLALLARLECRRGSERWWKDDAEKRLQAIVSCWVFIRS